MIGNIAGYNDGMFLAMDGTEKKYGNVGMNVRFNQINTNNKYGETPIVTYAFSPCFGSGTKPVEVNDYDMDKVNTDISIAGASAIGSPDRESQYMASFAIVVENKKDYPITLSEIGLFSANSTSSWDKSQIVLLYREVFDPVTIQPGEAFTFTINFK